MSLRHFFLCMLMLLAAAPAGAVASSWSAFGGGPARAGHDALDHGARTPVSFAWQRTSGQTVRAGPVVSWGAPGGTRVTSGVEAGNVFVQSFSDGTIVGSPGGVALDDATVDDTDTFGTSIWNVSPVTVSSALDPGQIYVLHNDDNQDGLNDIALAQIDAATGVRVQDVPFSGTDGWEVSSSPVITEPDGNGTARLLFVASGPGGVRLYRVDIANAASNSASWATPGFTSANNANPIAAPALVWFEDANGIPTQYAALGTSGGTFVLQTYAVSTLAPGPAASGAGTTGQTPAVPLTGDGLVPGAPKSGLSTTPILYIAGTLGPDTYVHKIAQPGSSPTLDVTTSPAISGTAAPAMAVSRRVGNNEADGVVALTTNENLYLLETFDLSDPPEQLSPTPLSAGQGFQRTAAALSDDHVFVARDNGEQLVLSTTDAQPVPAAQFTQSASNSGSSASYAGPALAAGRAIFASNNGTFSYSTTDGTIPRVRVVGPEGVVSGSVTLLGEAYDARGIDRVEFRVDGVPAGTAEVPQAGSSPPHAVPGALYGVSFDTANLAGGDHLLEAVAFDLAGRSNTSSAPLTVAGGSAKDTDPPETTILTGPRRRTADTTPRFRFSSSEEPEAFECSLDGKRFRSCPSRHVLALVSGRHRLSVRAVDAAGNVDPTPSVRSFTVLAPGSVEVSPTAPIELKSGGKVAVPVTCHSRRRCRGLLVVYAIVPRASAGSVRAAPARKGRKLRVGKRRFAVSARTRRKVLVRVSAAGRRLLRRNGRVKALAKVKLNTPTGVERSSWPLTLTDKED